jgi:hypothetical protein
MRIKQGGRFCGMGILPVANRQGTAIPLYLIHNPKFLVLKKKQNQKLSLLTPDA